MRISYNRTEVLPDIYQYIIVFALILSAISVHSWAVSKISAYGFVLISYSLMLTIIVLNGKLDIILVKWIAIPIFIIFIIYSLKLLVNPSFDALLRLVAFPISFVCGVTIFPYYIYIKKFTYFLSRSSIIMLIIGFFGLAISYDPLIWRTTTQIFPGININIPVIKSVFVNPQTLGLICLIGMISSLYLYAETEEISEVYIGIFLGYGMWVTQHRATLLGLGMGIVFFIAYIKYKTVGVTAFLTVGFLGFVLALLMVYGVLPGLSGLDLGGRKHLWYLAFVQFLHKPIIGYGPVQTSNLIGHPPHSILFRMLITGGILATSAYFYVFGYVFTHIPSSIESEELIIFTSVFVLLVVDMFSGNSIFGFSLLSIIMSLFLGYSLKILINRKSDDDKEILTREQEDSSSYGRNSSA
jgi:hypothetical protein